MLCAFGFGVYRVHGVFSVALPKDSKDFKDPKDPREFREFNFLLIFVVFCFNNYIFTK